MGQRYKIFLAQPTYSGQAHVESVLAASAQASKRHDVHYFTFGTSLLGMTFNVLWARSVQGHLKGEQGLKDDKGEELFPVRYDLFAMLHSDICPEPGWLDKIVDILDEQKVTVASA